MPIKALLIVDVQYDFLPNGSLAVPGSDAILPEIYERLACEEEYGVVVVSMDCEYQLEADVRVCMNMYTDHPEGHISFASTHSREPFNEIRVPKLNTDGETVLQMLWPDHCVQDTLGCRIEEGVQQRLDALDQKKVKYIRKGTHTEVDAYSAFSDNAYTIFTPLAKILHEHGVEEVDVVGLALDYCIKWTAIDARKFGFTTRVLRTATRCVDGSGEENVLKGLQRWGVEIV